jgi:hypothetical protein
LAEHAGEHVLIDDLGRILEKLVQVGGRSFEGFAKRGGAVGPCRRL